MVDTQLNDNYNNINYYEVSIKLSFHKDAFAFILSCTCKNIKLSLFL